MVGSRETGNETYVLGIIDGLVSLDGGSELYIYHAGNSVRQAGPRVHPRRLLGSGAWSRLTFDLPIRSWTDHLDVIHTTYAAPLWSRCPVVLTVHDICYTSHPEWFSNRDLRVLSASVPWSIRRAARVITVSEVCRAEIIDRYRVPEEKVVCVYNAAGPAAQELSQAEARDELSALGIDPTRPYILAVGNLQPRKNLVRLIQAFKRMVKEGIDVDLVLVGPEHFRSNLVREAAADLDTRVHLTGYVSHRQLAACYRCAAVFAFPSLFEGFGIPALEAMSHGTPVVCARAGALPEVCADAAMYFDPNDVESMAEALVRVLTDESLRAELSRAGRARARRFSWQQAAKQTLAVYGQATGQLSSRETAG
ncbi:MAG: glycosyltransferase family 4 protein [Candidatus Dormibacterales bacterium]|jgi:glycosyltransferase involved in cell wall biosynthesis